MKPIVIADINIKTDAEGRYCLNDLHKAAGGNVRHKPGNFTSRGEFFDLKRALENDGISAIKSQPGRYGGTYAVKELVYAYAMWISATFHLKVIRAYDTLQTQGIAVADHAAEAMLQNPLEFMQKALDQAKKLQAENSVLVHQNTGMKAVVGK